MQGMLSLLLFAGALHVDLSELRAYRVQVAVLAVLGTIVSTLFVAVGLWLVLSIAGLSLSAADDAAPAKPKRAKPTAEEMKKYDKNGDGKLDKEEKAAMNADKKKAKEAAPAPAK